MDPRGFIALLIALLVLDWFFVGVTLPGDPIFERIASALASTMLLIITVSGDANNPEY